MLPAGFEVWKAATVFFSSFPSARFHLRCLVGRSRPLFFLLFVCLFVSISLFSSSFCLGFVFPERYYGNWYVVLSGFYFCFITAEEMEYLGGILIVGVTLVCSFVFRGVLFASLSLWKQVVWRFGPMRARIGGFFFSRILLKRRGEIGSCMN